MKHEQPQETIFEFCPTPYLPADRLLDRPELTELVSRSLLQSHIFMLVAPVGYGKSTLIEQWHSQHPALPTIRLQPKPLDNSEEPTLAHDQQPLTQHHFSLQKLNTLLETSGVEGIIEISTALQSSIATQKSTCKKAKTKKTKKPSSTQKAESKQSPQPKPHKTKAAEKDPYGKKLLIIIRHAQNLDIQLWEWLTETISLYGKQICFILSAEAMPKKTYLNNLQVDTVKANQLKFSTAEVDRFLGVNMLDQSNSIRTNNLLTLKQISGWPILVNALKNCQGDKLNKHCSENTLFQQLCSEFIESCIMEHLTPQAYTLLECLSRLPLLSYGLANSLWPGNKALVETVNELEQRQLVSVNPITGELSIQQPWIEEHFKGKPPKFLNSFERIDKGAATWYLQQNYIGHAISSLMHLKAWEHIATLVGLHSATLIKGNDSQKVTQWLEKLPSTVIEKHPNLLNLLAWQSISLLRKTKAADYINRASTVSRPFTLKRTGKEKNYALIHKLKKVDLNEELENLNDISDTIHLITEKKSFEQQNFLLNTISKDSKSHEGIKLFLKALQQFCNNDLKGALKSCKALVKKSQQSKNATLTLNALFLKTFCLFQLGDVVEIQTQSQQTHHWLSDNGFKTHPLFNWALGCQALVYKETGQLEKAQPMLRKLCQSFLKEDSPILYKYATLLIQSQFYKSVGDLESALNSIEHAEALTHHLPAQFTRQLIPATTQRIDLYIIQEKLTEAKQVMTSYPDHNWRDYPDEADLYRAAQSCYLNITKKEICEIEQDFKLLINIAKAKNNRYLELYIRTFLALSLHRRAEHKKARHALMSLLKQIDNSPFKRLLLDRGKHFGNLLLKTANKYPQNQQLIPWLEAIKHESYKDNLYYDLINLSGREIEILSLIAKGSSNEDIAGELCRSLGTIKLHIHNIYKKLGVSSRVQAIQKCESCGFDAELTL